MHMMIGEQVHNSDGKLMLNSQAKRGFAISYTEYHRLKFEMAAYTSKNHVAHVVRHDHFDPGEFTWGTTDNWDYKGEPLSEHDAVTVLFQNEASNQSWSEKTPVKQPA